MISIAALALLLALSCNAVGCATVVHPPKQVQTPARVYLADYGKHTSLLMPTQRGGRDMLVEYAFGDLAYFRDNRTSPLYAAWAVAIPTAGTLGRRFVPHAADEADLARNLWGPSVTSLVVDRDEVVELAASLNERFRAGGEPQYNPRTRLHHVRSRSVYHGLWNCNHVLARWLRRLDCRVVGLAMFSNFTVAAEKETQP